MNLGREKSLRKGVGINVKTFSHFDAAVERVDNLQFEILIGKKRRDFRLSVAMVDLSGILMNQYLPKSRAENGSSRRSPAAVDACPASRR